jgi:hypothetical protein
MDLLIKIVLATWHLNDYVTKKNDVTACSCQISIPDFYVLRKGELMTKGIVIQLKKSIASLSHYC